MKTVMKSVFMVLAAGLLLATAGCSDDNNPARSVQPNIVETAVSAGQFNTLVAAVEAAGLADDLSGAGPFTVFAPTDMAFDMLPEGTVETLLLPENLGTLQDILLYHVLSGSYDASAITAQESWATLLGPSITVDVNGSVVLNAGTENPATVVTTDIETSNGIIHVIDAVLIP